MRTEGTASQPYILRVIGGFSLATEDFVFGTVLATVEEMAIELEATVPTGNRVVPYWTSGGDSQAFERHVLDDADIESSTQLDRIGATALYRVERSTDLNGLLDGIAASRAVVLEAMAVENGWHFRVRFPDHDLLGQFYNSCTERDVSIHVDRVYTLAVASRAGRAFDLTPAQREALGIAVRGGYFQVPRETDLTAIADELGISQQAASKRIRRGADGVLRGSLLAPRAEA